jgi:hypothetical protein
LLSGEAPICLSQLAEEAGTGRVIAAMGCRHRLAPWVICRMPAILRGQAIGPPFPGLGRAAPGARVP